MLIRKLFTLLSFFLVLHAQAQTLYYPPSTGNTWDTVSSASLGWCQPRIDSLVNYVQAHNTDGLIILKDGKMALEKYFGSFTQSSTHIWASAGKSLTAMLTGIAQEHGFLNISDTVSTYLGQGWTSCSVAQENEIRIRNLIIMSSGLNDNPSGILCGNNSTGANCLQYLALPGTRWAYHTGAYRKMQDVIAAASGMNFNTFTNSYLGAHTGMGGSWNNYIFSSTVRDAARFGLLALGKGIWANDTLLHDTAYYSAMTNTSQNFNLSYGYLWWLNGHASYMLPGSQTVYQGPLVANAAPDMFAALGASDQKIYVVPSRNMVVVRMGSSAYGVSEAFSPFDNLLWGYIDSLTCSIPTGTNEVSNAETLVVYPNPAQLSFNIDFPNRQYDFILSDVAGRKVYGQRNNSGRCFVSSINFSAGIYFLEIQEGDNRITKKIILTKE